MSEKKISRYCPFKAVLHAVGDLHLPGHIRLQPGGRHPASGGGLRLALIQGQVAKDRKCYGNEYTVGIQF